MLVLNNKIAFFVLALLNLFALAFSTRPFTPTMQIPSPVFVSSVNDNGAASQAGITVGDYILKVFYSTIINFKTIILLDMMWIIMDTELEEKPSKS